VRHDSMYVFSALTAGRGQVPISLRLCFDQDYETDLLRMGDNVLFPTEHQQKTTDLVFDIRGFVFPHFGSYTFELRCEDIILASRRFEVDTLDQTCPHHADT